MLKEIPLNSKAITTCAVHDITEDRPIPRGRVVAVEDYDRCAGLYVVEYRDRIYLASPDELRA